MARKKFAVGSYALVVKRARVGRGLFAGERVKKGACIAEYKGRVLSKKEEYTSRSRYLFEVSKSKTIDGWVKGNIARFINHACKPNCEIEIAGGHVYVVTKRAIRAGEELTYDYDTEYVDEYIKPKGCKCTSCLKKN